MEEYSFDTDQQEYVVPVNNTKRPVILAVVSLFAISCFILLNVWLYRLGKMSARTPVSPLAQEAVKATKTPPNDTIGKQTLPNVLGESKTNVLLEKKIPSNAGNLPPDTATHPRPTGPGINACDPLGKCNSYADPKSSACPVTFADTGCLNQCSDPKNRCRE